MNLPQHHHPDDHRHIENLLHGLGDFAEPVKQDYSASYQEHGRQTANLDLLDKVEIVEHLNTENPDDSTLKGKAAIEAAKFERIIKAKGIAGAEQQLVQIGLPCPVIPKSTRRFDDLDPITEGKIRRLTNPKRWQGQLRNKLNRESELAAIRLGLVKHYASDNALVSQLVRQQLNREHMESQDAVDIDTGETFNMGDMIDAGVSNPANRRAETMTRISDAETFYQNKGYTGLFLTLTLSSKHHARKKIGTHSKKDKMGVSYQFGGKSIPNPKYQPEILWTVGTGENQRQELRENTPRLGQQRLAQLWARTRSACKDQGIEFAWVRIAEPHHDATPHWHMLVFLPNEQVAKFSSLVWKYFLTDEPNEPGAKAKRVEVVKINPKKGSAASYVAKYISKNIDGFAVGEDFESGLDAASASDRAAAWRSLWGIRGFQFSANIGAVTKWREFRRMQEAPGGMMERARFAADTADWFAYMHIQERLEQPFTFIREDTDKPNAYGEIVEKVKGLAYEPEQQQVITRSRNWEIVQREGAAELNSPSRFEFLARSNRECLGLVENNCRKPAGTETEYRPPDDKRESDQFAFHRLRSHWNQNRPLTGKDSPPKAKYSCFAEFFEEIEGKPAPARFTYPKGHAKYQQPEAIEVPA